MRICVHCQREIVWEPQDDRWIDPQASGDDVIWRDHCDSNDHTLQAEHQPTPARPRCIWRDGYESEEPGAILQDGAIRQCILLRGHAFEHQFAAPVPTFTTPQEADAWLEAQDV